MGTTRQRRPWLRVEEGACAMETMSKRWRQKTWGQERLRAKASSEAKDLHGGFYRKGVPRSRSGKERATAVHLINQVK